VDLRGEPFRGKTVIVTGASQGIGRAIALAFHEAGATVVMAARSIDLLRSIAAEAPPAAGRLIPCQADVTDDASVQAMADLALAETGRIDILVNNAGLGLNGPVAELGLEQWQHAVQVNLFGAVRCIQKVVPAMRRQGGGQIIQISSVAGRVSVPYVGAYSATKFALNAISDALRIEETPARIQVISVYPGSTESNFRQNALGAQKWPKVRPAKVSAGVVAERVLAASLRGERDVYIRWKDRLLCWFGERFPRLGDWVLRKAYRLVP
jgi:uncharacterized protein